MLVPNKTNLTKRIYLKQNTNTNNKDDWKYFDFSILIVTKLEQSYNISANRGQKLQYAVFDLGLHCLPLFKTKRRQANRGSLRKHAHAIYSDFSRPQK